MLFSSKLFLFVDCWSPFLGSMYNRLDILVISKERSIESEYSRNTSSIRVAITRACEVSLAVSISLLYLWIKSLSLAISSSV